MNSSSPESAHWRSSNTSTTGALSDIRSKNSRQPLNRSARSGAGSLLEAAAGARAAARRGWRSRSSVTTLCHGVAELASARSRGPPPRRFRPARGPSPRAPSRRPRRRRRGSGPGASARTRSTPSRYLKNSHSSLDLPEPASPTTVTRRARRCSRALLEGVEITWASSRSRPTNGASSPAPRRAPPAPATTRNAVHACTACSRPLTMCSPASS